MTVEMTEVMTDWWDAMMAATMARLMASRTLYNDHGLESGWYSISGE